MLEVSVEAGIDYTYYSRILGGKRQPGRGTIDALAVALRASPYEHARLLALYGYLPHLDDDFADVVSRMAGHWIGGRGAKPSEGDPG